MNTTGCTVDGCNRRQRARGWCGPHDQGPHQGSRSEQPLICICETPQPTPTDMCAVCLRVIADLVHARRWMKANMAAYDPPPRPRGVA